MSAFQAVSQPSTHALGTACYGCSHRAFVSFAQLIDLTTVTCRATEQRQRCGNKKLAVTLHGVGLKTLRKWHLTHPITDITKI